jgi:hypothetical protein
MPPHPHPNYIRRRRPRCVPSRCREKNTTATAAAGWPQAKSILSWFWWIRKGIVRPTRRPRPKRHCRDHVIDTANRKLSRRPKRPSSPPLSLISRLSRQTHEQRGRHTLSNTASHPYGQIRALSLLTVSTTRGSPHVCFFLFEFEATVGVWVCVRV